MAKAGSVISAAPPDIYGQMNPSEQRRLATAGKRNASLTAIRDLEAEFDACFRAHYAEVLAMRCGASVIGALPRTWPPRPSPSPGAA
jgi:hypothetical protein